jgi:hypothetical protein
MGQVENNSAVTKMKSSQSFDWEDFFLPVCGIGNSRFRDVPESCPQASARATDTPCDKGHASSISHEVY